MLPSDTNDKQQLSFWVNIKSTFQPCLTLQSNKFLFLQQRQPFSHLPMNINKIENKILTAQKTTINYLFFILLGIQLCSVVNQLTICKILLLRGFNFLFFGQSPLLVSLLLLQYGLWYYRTSLHFHFSHLCYDIIPISSTNNKKSELKETQSITYLEKKDPNIVWPTKCVGGQPRQSPSTSTIGGGDLRFSARLETEV